MNDSEIYRLAEQVGQSLCSRKLILATAESCTGGGVSMAITAVAGSSAWFERGFVTYSNRAKSEMLGVAQATLERFGAVSEPVAIAMAEGARQCSGADVAVAVSGIAGPGGGSADKPVGMVCFAWSGPSDQTVGATEYLPGDRSAVRRQAIIIALQGLLRVV